MKSTFLKLRLYILGISVSLTYGAVCGPSEYMSAANECCPMCTIGSVVFKDCFGDYSTTCKPCSKGTFMHEPNGLYTCFPCKTCDSGLYILHDCTTMKDAVCDVSDGYYCINPSKTEDCSLAMKHSQCKQKERIKTPGTKASDTVCEPCPPGFYSPDSVNCSKLTDCSVENDTEVQPIPRTWNMRYGLIFCVFLLLVIVLYLTRQSALKCCIILKRPVEETNQQTTELAPSSSQL